jgi:putative ABC transport system permease protein
LDDDLRQELDTHLALIEEDARARGASAAQARRDARVRFGSPLVYREQSIDVVISTWADALWQDVRFGSRQLVRCPGLTASVVLLLGMGLGLNAGILTVLNSVVMRALPLTDPDHLVAITERSGRFETPTSWPDFRDLRDRNRVLASAAAFTPGGELVFRGAGDPRNVRGSAVTREYFSTLGVTPIAGRIFETSEAEQESRVVLVREDFWRVALGADPAIVGKSIALNGAAVDVIGILPSWFRFPADDTVLWTPLQPRGPQADRGWHAFAMVGRLRPGVTVVQAQEDFESIMQRLAETYPEKNAGHHAMVRRLQEWSLDGPVRDRLVVLQIAALVLGLLAVANVSGLLLARYSTRRQEFAIRAALDASRKRQVRQHVTESLLLTGAGGVVAAGFAWSAVRFLVWVYGPRLPRAAEISPDWRLVGIVTIAATGIALTLGGLTAWHEDRAAAEASLQTSHRARDSRGGTRTRQILVVSQVAGAVVLLAVTGATLQRVWSLLHVDIGIDRTHLLTMQINLPAAMYRGGADIGTFFERVTDRVRALPGVASAAAINMLPIAEWGFNGNVNVEGLPAHGQDFFAEYRWVTPDYFRTMGVPLTRGRLFLPEEVSGTRQAGIINETMARRLWGERDPLGAHVRFLSPEWITVVGVVRDIRQTSVTAPPSAEIFLPARTFMSPFRRWSLAVRSPVSTDALVPAIRRAVQLADSQAALDRVRTMDDVVADSVADQRIVTTLLVWFGILALVLAALGISSLIAYSVVVRTPELAIRAALGSTPVALVRLVGRQGVVLVTSGVVLGIAASFPASAGLATTVFGISRIGLPVFSGVAAILILTGGLATVIPAARTARIDPLRALRQD